MNSFPKDKIRVSFSSKFHQCLMVGRMLRKPVVCGPKESDKNSWMNVLMGIIPMSKVVLITQKERWECKIYPHQS